MTTVWARALTIALTLFSQTSWANEITIDQIGDNLALTIVQQGNNNNIGGKATTDAPVSGNDNTININQGNTGHNTIDLAIDGNNNNVVIGQEKYYNGSWSEDTNSFGRHYADVDVLGNNNDIEIVQRNNNTSNWGHDSRVSIVNGDDNNVTTLQTGTGGTIGHTSYVRVNNGRDGNTVDIFQNSNNVHHRSVVSVYSDDNNIDINQTGNTQNNAYVLFSTHSTGPTDFTLNQNGGDTYGNPDTGYATISCGNANGCIVTVNQ